MTIRNIPNEISELEKVYKPYMVGCHLENPTPEAIEAFEKVKTWYLKQLER